MTTTLTNIRNNGTVGEVIELLKTNPLARRFEFTDMPAARAFITSQWIGVSQSFPTEKGRCYMASETQDKKGLTCFHGNFFDWSFCFDIATDDPQLIETLTALVLANIQRPDYLSQDAPTLTMGEHYILMQDGTELWWNNGIYEVRPCTA
jgi:hypothetical protein